MDKTIITDAFRKLSDDVVQKQLRDIYSHIYRSVRNEEPELLANKITTLESKAINSFYLNLEKQTREVAAKAMLDSGVAEAQIPMTWLKVRRAVKAPQAELCNQKGYAQRAPKLQSESLEHRGSFPAGKCILVSGIVVEVIAWLFLPAYQLWAPIAKGIGLLLIGSGAYKIYQNQKNQPRISLSEEAIRAGRAKSDAAIREICQQQCSLNTKIYETWITDLRDRIIDECERLV